MKMRERTARRPSAAVVKSTADLFAAERSVEQPSGRQPSSDAPSRARLTALEVPSEVSSTSPPLLRPRPRQLWYAAVFPKLDETQAPVLLQRLSLTGLKFTSRVSLELPNALLLDIKGSVKLFGSLETLHADIDSAWRRLGMQAQSATAPTPLAALWCARAGREVRIEEAGQLAGCLAELPLACTGWDAEWLQTLRSMGVTRVGHLLRLPRAGLARRLKPAAVRDLDILLGRQAAPRRPFVPRQRFRERCDFETEIETVVYLQKALEPLIERCAQFLRKRQAGVQALELKLKHRVMPLTRVRLGLASVTSERRRLADVLDQKLTRLELAAPVRGMELVSGALQPLSADSLDAFAGLRGGGRDTAPQLVERLRARLGEEAVYGVCTIAEHRPEAAWQRVQELPLASGVTIPYKKAERGSNDPNMPRPVWLLDAPVKLYSAGLPNDLILEQGPERIESGWWDGNGVERDYYIASEPRGGRWWIFQERQTQCWYLHGVFA